jgi:hypothetical protein
LKLFFQIIPPPQKGLDPPPRKIKNLVDPDKSG